MGKFLRQVVILVFACLLSCNLHGQLAPDSTSLRLYEWVEKTAGIENTGLYQGPLYLMVSRSRYTHPFFETKLWQQGNVKIGDDYYFNVSMIYDIHSEQLVLKHPDPSRRDGIRIEVSHLVAFDLGKHHFKKLPEVGDQVLYNILFEGTHFSLVARRRKVEELDTQGSHFVQKDQRFLYFNSVLIPFRKKKDLEKVHPDSKQLLLDIAKASNTKWKMKDEGTMVEQLTLFDAKLH